jgi:hypothetical protein
MRASWAIALVLGCGRALHPEAPARSVDGILSWAATRASPDPAQARLDLHVLSPAFSGGTNGVLVTDGPERTHLAVLGLFGSPVLTLTVDARGLTVDLPADARRLVAPDAAAVLADVTRGALRPNDLTALLRGGIPWASREPDSKRRLPDGSVAAVWDAPTGFVISAVIAGDTGCPREVTAVLDDTTVLAARWEPFEPVELGGATYHQPTHLALTAGETELSIRYKAWKVLDAVPPVFDTPVPPGTTVESLAAAGPGLGITALLGGMFPPP